MTVTNRVLCNLDHEAEGFHGNAVAAFAVNLNFELVHSPASDDDVPPSDEQAQLAFTRFLHAASDVRFYVFRAEQTGDTLALTYWAGLADAAVGGKHLKEPSQSPEPLIAWLSERGKERAGFWTTVDPQSGTVGQGVEIDGRLLQATHLLRSSQSWNAPVAHRFGLTHLAKLPATLFSKDVLAVLPDLILLPWFDESVPPATLTAEKCAFQDDCWDVAYTPGGGFPTENVVCRTQILALQNKVHLGGRLTREGYLRADQDADNTRRLLNWFEERATALMSPYVALSGLETVTFEEVENQNQEIFPVHWITQTGTPEIALQAPEMAWLAATGLASLLDPLVLGLGRPASLEHDPDGRITAWSEGQVMSVFVSGLSGQIREKLGNTFGDIAARFTPSLILIATRRFLSRSALHHPDKRADFAGALRIIHGIPTIAEKQNASDRLLNTLLDIYQQNDRTVALPVQAKLARQISGPLTSAGAPCGLCMTVFEALGSFQQALNEEAGAETAIIRYFETAAPIGKFGSLLRDALVAVYEETTQRSLDNAVKDALVLAAEAARAEFVSALEGGFNGAEALRRSAGADFVASLLSDIELLPAGEEATSNRLVRVIADARFFSRRLLSVGPGAFAGVVDNLGMPPAFGLVAQFIARLALDDYLDRKYAQVIAPIKSVVSGHGRFVADLTPQPLAIALSDDYTGRAFDDFAADFNGIGLLIRRMDSANPPWAHANLAELTCRGEAPAGADIPIAVHPALPAISDGRAPSFLAYEGLPLAGSGFDKDAVSGGEAIDGFKPFYQHDVANYASAEVSGFTRTPSLAYGKNFQTLAFVTTNAGTLPETLRDGMPWTPTPQPLKDVIEKDLPKDALLKSTYQRRTAIGAVSLSECDKFGLRMTAGRRLGAGMDGVLPLSSDYPRLGMVATAVADGVLDLFRGLGGAGQLTLPEENNGRRVSTLNLAALSWQDGPATLHISFHHDGRDGALSAVPFTISIPLEGPKAVAQEDLSLTIEALKGDDTTPPGRCRLQFVARLQGKDYPLQPFDYPDDCMLWVRLRLSTDTGKAVLSLSDPKGQRSADRNDRPLLLLAAGDDWQQTLTRPVYIDIVAPRVGYTDFERWLANDDLLERRFGGHPKAEILRHTLLIADGLKHQNRAVMEALTKLPDPSVDRLLVELIVTDRLSPAGSHSVPSMTIDLADRFTDLLSELPDTIDGIGARHISGLINGIEKNFNFLGEIRGAAGGMIELGAGGQGRAIAVVLPPGVVAELRICPMVESDHFQRKGDFPAVFHEGMLNLTRRQTTDEKHYIFSGAAIAIETAYDAFAETSDWLRLVEQRIESRPAAGARLYDVISAGLPRPAGKSDVVTDDDRRLWRAVGEVDIVTQRWRNTGRPIYHMIAPKTGNTLFTGAAAQPIAADRDDEALETFETEIFFSREDIDAEIVTKRLDPAPGTTVLQQFIWNAPSATYFRHRFVLRSRYSGAATANSVRARRTWQQQKTDDSRNGTAWTLRVALLADYARLTLTRPQVRALLPLTNVPSVHERISATPPIAVFLQERPYAHGGLADRIAADLKTGFGYAFDTDRKLGIVDARKEIGPDPRLSYTSMQQAAALGLAMQAEGSVGLTFDDPSSPAPAFANSMQVLTPVSATDMRLPSLEEHFAGISLRRYIDPDWIVDEVETSNQSPFAGDAAQCAWIDYDPALFVEGKPVDGWPSLNLNDETILFFKKIGDAFPGQISVKTRKALLDPLGSPGGDTDIELARFDLRRIAKLSVLHHAIAPDRYSTCVFVVIHAENGMQNQFPVLLTSFEWSLANTRTDTPPLLQAKNALAFVRCLASAPTSIAWVRTGRNFDRVHLSPHDLPNSETGDHIEDVPNLYIEATAGPAATVLDVRHREAPGPDGLWLCGSSVSTPYPLHVHRHLAAVTTRFAGDAGRPVELFGHAVLVNKRRISIPQSIGMPDRLRLVEFEAPAAILCAGPDKPAIPATYKSAYFDLVSTGFRPEDFEASGSIRLVVRFVGQSQHLTGFSKLDISLFEPRDNEESPGQDPARRADLAVDLNPTAQQRFAVGAQLRLTHQTRLNNGIDSVVKIAASLVFADGTAAECGTKTAIWKSDFPGFVLQLETPGAAAEFWADISLLHSAHGQSGFDFDWLFSPATRLPPETATKPSALNQMTEAQARIVAVSPPIEIFKPLG